MITISKRTQDAIKLVQKLNEVQAEVISLLVINEDFTTHTQMVTDDVIDRFEPVINFVKDVVIDRIKDAMYSNEITTI